MSSIVLQAIKECCEELSRKGVRVIVIKAQVINLSCGFMNR